MPITKETRMPMIKFIVIIDGFDIRKGSLTRAAPNIMGTANKNENLAAPSLVSPINNPMVMVIPERETPGIIASA
jgi:hypothetical protein